MNLFRRLLLVLLAGVAGFLLSGVLGCGLVSRDPASDAVRSVTHYFRLPHHVPEHPGGVAFRFAMVHDVLHERFPRHGAAHYRERDRLTRQALASLSPDDPAAWELTDDLATGLDRLGRPGEGVAVLRAKLARLRARGRTGRDLYTSFANLGTLLIHENFPAARAGDGAAQARLREGIDCIRQSVAVNPGAHFGRERWQLAVAEFLLAATANPRLLAKFDCLGNELEQDLGLIRLRPFDAEFRYGRKPQELWLSSGFDLDLADPERWTKLSPVRQQITHVGAGKGWGEVAVSSHQSPAPFDEPCLGIIGMWRQGGGANPHFALALGETMLRVGQRYTAWAAFERASRLADRYWPDPAIQKGLREHCARRQESIEISLQDNPPRSGRGPFPSPPKTAEELRGLFEQELARGEEYQRAYQEYEARRLAAGASLTDPAFFADFHAAHQPIESPVGEEELLARQDMGDVHTAIGLQVFAWGLFGAGPAALAVALWLRRQPAWFVTAHPRAGPPPEAGSSSTVTRSEESP